WAGLTTAEAARRLGWPKGTVLTRLAWARQRLRTLLARRGVASAAVSAALAAAAPPPAGAAWVDATARAAKGLWAGKSLAEAGFPGSIVSLTEGAVRAMFLDRMKYVVAVLLVIGLVGFGLVRWALAEDGRAGGGRDGAGAGAQAAALAR